MTMTIKSFDSDLKDLYAPPGALLKQWVVDTRRENAWVDETCPRFTPAEHDDNTEMECRNSMRSVPWTHLDHDCCYFCGDLHEWYRETAEVRVWLDERDKRPPIEADHSKYSDQVEPEWPSMRSHPLLAMLPNKR